MLHTKDAVIDYLFLADSQNVIAGHQIHHINHLSFTKNFSCFDQL